MNIVVTGASRGIGQAVCQQLMTLQTEVHILAISRSSIPKPLPQGNPSSTITTLNTDISCEPENIVNHINLQLKWKNIHGILHNAGTMLNKPFSQTTSQDIRSIFETNTIAPYILTQLLLPLLQRAKSSHVVSIGSMGGFQGSSKYPGLSAYSMSKSALANFTECMAAEFAESNIRFNCLALGAVQTEMLKEAFPSYKAPTTSKEMAEYITHFLLNQHQVMNGQIIPVRISNP